eukprot:CAMPEP_0114587996 /NCGR_PEP_ID=MMETSP0125-20121206/10815_1 /TAXON_ID=485358 ORGANISM="Aristerostoma sp., Strain ATCC 50986" /NCGR_SAMPLE_ID=MMETSP0125 /ASSEMBLY_ACC=CAM_ASM_000245 /LENGTH=109 /DNA_ID=CAMNT_0001784183 /DNA_START=59 /DNA_END=388 /DNA_ORIENTATION=+
MNTQIPPDVRATIETVLKDEKLLNETATKIFHQFDRDENKVLDRKEVDKLYDMMSRELKVPKPTAEEIDKVYDEMDKNKDGLIQQDEFVELFKHVSKDYLDGKLFGSKE